MNKALKILTLAALVVLASMAFATIASADPGAGPHGGYSITTSACSACHRVHTALGKGDLLKVSNVYDLCTSCHGGSVPTNVQAGWYSSGASSGRMNGGGFGTYLTPPQTDGGAWGGGSTPPSTTSIKSAHKVDGLTLSDGRSNAGGVGIAWGGDSHGKGLSGTLECTSCHNPHGSINYRLLRDTENGYPYTDTTYTGSGAWQNDYKVLISLNQHRWVTNTITTSVSFDGSSLWWNWTFNGADPKGTITDPAAQITATQIVTQVAATTNDNHNYAAGDTANYTGGMRLFCATCHKTYLTQSGARNQQSDVGSKYYFTGTQQVENNASDDQARYRHTTVRTYTEATKFPLRFAATSASSTNRTEFTCLTCHFAHGSPAKYDGYSANIKPTDDSALLYYDNRGVCNSCHQKTK